ncbi:hypothetical protein [Prosthecobacter sp.]|uniref:hypothetical protein n=1 Tax=Prosthecobacter sp. TaxID=1965333 RepID=UPI0037831771
MNETTLSAAAETKPEISQLEANQRAFLAGIKAEQEARARGVASEDAATLLDAAVGGVVIAGIGFPPIHPAFILMQDRLAEFAKVKTILNHPSADCAATAFILKNPELAWNILKRKEPEAVELFYETVTEFGMSFTTADFKKLFEWVALENQRMLASGDAAGKSSAA